ncbi:hypothetical protein VPNG_02331 [Cytospora leucostoma]|uniref:Uncharacterized protein n=1 Tax=Cytospora leucostoma TaxID=1230097 RepID=A0A423XGX4_9PEZI|nr:hypothetical protein VPNG_02331 [Cytospora leucostoma]
MTSTSADLCKIPAGVSPDGVYNFVDPPCLGFVVIAVGVVLGVISTALASGRLYLNRFRLHSADYFTIMACMTNIAYTGRDSHQFALGGRRAERRGDDAGLLYILFAAADRLAPPHAAGEAVTACGRALLGVAAGVVSLYFKVKILSSGDPYDTAWLAAITSMCSLIESNIAIIVGSMPAFAQVVTVHIAESAFFKSLVKLLGSRRGRSSSRFNSKSKEKTPDVLAIGVNQAPRRDINYYELTGSALLKTHATVMSATEEPEPHSGSYAPSHYVRA